MKMILMHEDCSELKSIIEELITDINSVKNIWDGLRADNPCFEEVSCESWKSKEALLWMHGATKTYEAIELERWLYATPQLSLTAQSLALDHYLTWSKYISKEKEDSEFETDKLPPPKKDDILIDYIMLLSEIVETRGWGTKKEKRALKSFLHFLRQDFDHNEEVAFIEHIFPKNIDLRGGKIIRKIRPQVLPISHQLAGAIIKELAYQCASGRANARHHAGEALALIWLCLSVSRIRWPRTLESVHVIKYSDIIFEKEYPELLAPSLFGPHPVRIGKRVARFLQLVAKIPSNVDRNTIIQTPLPDLRKALNTAIQSINIPPKLGEITFLTFLSYPHHFGENIRKSHLH